MTRTYFFDDAVDLRARHISRPAVHFLMDADRVLRDPHLGSSYSRWLFRNTLLQF